MVTVVAAEAAEYAAISNQAAVNSETTADLFILVNKRLDLKEEVAAVEIKVVVSKEAVEATKEVAEEEEEATREAAAVAAKLVVVVAIPDSRVESLEDPDLKMMNFVTFSFKDLVKLAMVAGKNQGSTKANDSIEIFTSSLKILIFLEMFFPNPKKCKTQSQWI